MKLNLGSNDVFYNGYTNIDIRPIEGCIVEDFTKLDSIEDNSVEAIMCHNSLNMVASDRVLDVLKLWHRKLKVGGELNVAVTDGEKIFLEYINKKYTWDRVVHGVFGNMELQRKWYGDDCEKMMGHCIFNKRSITNYLTEAGFDNIQETNSRHSDVIAFLAYKP